MKLSTNINPEVSQISCLDVGNRNLQIREHDKNIKDSGQRIVINPLLTSMYTICDKSNQTPAALKNMHSLAIVEIIRTTSSSVFLSRSWRGEEDKPWREVRG